MLPHRLIRKLIAGLIVYVATSAAQTLSPGEVRITTRSYVPGVAFKAESRLVELDVVVRDSKGRPVSGLKAADFLVSDAGKKREITAFSVNSSTAPEAPVRNVASTPTQALNSNTLPPAVPETHVPETKVSSDNNRTIALFFDDINSGPGDLGHAKIAATRFLKEGAGAGSAIGLFTSSRGKVLEFTTDSQQVIAAIATVQPHPRAMSPGLASCPRMTPFEAYQIVASDPMAMQAKVEEACHCGQASCEVSNIPPAELLSSASRASEGVGGGAGTLSSVISSVKAQAEQTWEHARLGSKTTLAAIQVAVDQLSQKPGKRILLLTSAGFPSNELDQEQDSIVDAALRSGVVIDSLDAKGLYAEAPGRPLNESVEVTELPVHTLFYETRTLGERLDSVDAAMARLAESTGGLFFRNNNDLDLGFYLLGVEPAVTYLLGFPPSNDGKYHKVKVELKNADHAIVQVRPGYFAAGSTANQQIGIQELIDTEVLKSDERNDVPSSVSEKVDTSSSGERLFMVQTHVDVAKIPFQSDKDRHIQELTFVAALFDEQGNFVTGKESEMALALKPESYANLSKTGINALLPLNVAAGSYRLRTILAEGIHQKLSMTSKPIQVP